MSRCFKSALEEGSFCGKAHKRRTHLHRDRAILTVYRPTIITDNSTSMRMDGNNVDIDTESSELAKNTIYYYTLIQKISSEFTRL